MGYLPVEVRRTYVLDVEGEELRATAVTKVKGAVSLAASEGILWIPARITDESEGPYGSSGKETYELDRDTMRHDAPVPSAMFEFDPSKASHFFDADAALEKKRRREAARKAYDAKYGAGDRVRAPDFASAEWLGEERSLEAVAGRVTLVVFWGKRCGRCIKAFPAYESLRKELGPKGFELVALHCQEPDPEHILGLIKKHACTFPVGQAGRELTSAYAVEGLPAYYLLDKEGKLVEGRLHELPSVERIGELLAE